MIVVMCQSAVSPLRGPLPCEIAASRVLFGVHLCGTHERVWRGRLARGEKIKVHPDRALPLDHQCVAHGGEEVGRTCTGCGASKPRSGFYRRSSGGGDRLMARCKPCFVELVRRSRSKKLAPVDRPGPKATVAPAEPPPTPAGPVPAPTPAALRTMRPIRATAPAADMPQSAEAPAAIHSGYVHVAELVCLHCGDHVADAVVASPATPARAPIGLRCQRCGGPPVQSGEVERRRVGPEIPFTDSERPRRGRPPRLAGATERIAS